MQVKAISACPEPAPATAGDVSAVFELIFSDHYTRLRKHLWYRVGHNWDVSDELAQATFAHLWERMSGGALVVSDPSYSWGLVLRLAQHTLGNYYRARAARPDRLRDGEPTSLDEVALSARLVSGDVDLIDARLCAAEIIAALPQDYRRVLSLHLLEDLTVRQVADETGLTLPQVRATVAEGLRLLRAELGVREDDIAQASDARREQARRLYRASVKTGQPMTLKALAARVGMGTTWVERTVRDLRPPAPRRPSALDVARTELRAEILAGVYPPGTPIPNNRDLAPRWDTTNATVSKALRDLVSEGLLTRDRRRRFVVPTGPQLPDAIATPRGDVAAYLRSQIVAGVYAPGTDMPALWALGQSLGVSEPTTREALSDLAAEGLLIRRNARPYRVADRIPGLDTDDVPGTLRPGKGTRMPSGGGVLPPTGYR